MELEHIVRPLVQLGKISISPYEGDGLFLGTLTDPFRKELSRASSDRGIEYLLYSLAAKALGDVSLLEKANKHHPYPTAPVSEEKGTELYHLCTKGCLIIFLIKDVVHIEQYSVFAHSFSDSLGPSFRRGIGSTFNEALQKIVHTSFESATYIADNPM